MKENESICRSCFHSYVCEQFNEHRNSLNEKCHFYNDHFVSAADVVEVVRCKDCIHWELINEHIPHMECNIFCGAYDHGYPTNADDFCSYGERRDTDAET